MIVVLDGSQRARSDRDERRDAAIHEAARAEMLRADGARDPGANLEQAAALIQAAFELAGSLDHLRTMKRTAGRPQDLLDLTDLETAHPKLSPAGRARRSGLLSPRSAPAPRQILRSSRGPR